MSQRPGVRSRTTVWTVTVLALSLCVAVPPLGGATTAAAGGTVGRKAAHQLSSRLRLLTRTPSAIGSAARATRHRARLLSLPRRGPGSLLGDGTNVMVDIETAGDASALPDGLTALGAEVVHSADDGVVTALVPAGALRSVAALPGVDLVEEILQPMTGGTLGAGGRTSQDKKKCPSGKVVSEGDKQLRAKQARKHYDVNGAGVTVGVLSDSFNRWGDGPTNAKDDVKSGDLPGKKNPCGFKAPVKILDDTSKYGNIDEGRAMAQIVHDLAPGAKLQFASAFTGERAFADNIRALRAAGSDVIVDDVYYFDEPFFQDGVIARAVNDVTADGAVYFSAAGNENIAYNKHANGSWMTPEYRPTDCPKLKKKLGANTCLDFDPSGGVDSDFGITIDPGRQLIINLQWAEAWRDPDMTNLDLYLVDNKGKVVGKSTGAQPTDSRKPVEILGTYNGSRKAKKVRVVIASKEGPGTPPVKMIFYGYWNMKTEYFTSSGGDVMGPTIVGHSGAENAMSIGAIRYSTNKKPEWFSSRGPNVLYFEPVQGNTPADPLPEPQVIAKPDVIATDGGANTFFLPPKWKGAFRFFGTSASAPHAAAVAALFLQLAPSASVGEVEAAMRTTGRTVGNYGPLAIGGGMVNAVAMLGTAPACRAVPQGIC